MKDFDIKSIWPDWSIVRLIGEGSFGKVYEIVRSNFGIEEHSAMKVIRIPSSHAELQSLRNEGMDDKSTTEYYRSFVEDFVQEIALMSKLKGKANIVGYEDYAVIEHKDTIGWDIVIRMELLTDLPSYIRKNSFCAADVIRLGMDVCSALEVCHEQKIIHRDIKPDNIFVSRNGDFKLGDFGVARTIEKTVSGLSKKGTYTYMAPEVYKGDSYGIDVDLYSLGIVMYKLLNNNREPFLPEYPTPIKYSDKNDALSRRLSGEDIPLPACADVASAYQQLGQIVLKACSFKSVDRYHTPTQMKIELKNVSTRDGYKKTDDYTENLAFSKEQKFGKFNEITEQETDKTMSAFGEDISAINSGVHNSKAITNDRNLRIKSKEEFESGQTATDNSEKMIPVLIFGWFGFAVSLAIAIMLFPYTVIQTIGILVSMIFITLKKGVKLSAIVMLVASVLSFRISNIVASIVALVVFSKKVKITPNDSNLTAQNNQNIITQNNQNMIAQNSSNISAQKNHDTEIVNNVCRKCGSELVPEAAFCGNCGEARTANHIQDKTVGIFNENPNFEL